MMSFTASRYFFILSLLLCCISMNHSKCCCDAAKFHSFSCLAFVKLPFCPNAFYPFDWILLRAPLPFNSLLLIISFNAILLFWFSKSFSHLVQKLLCLSPAALYLSLYLRLLFLSFSIISCQPSFNHLLIYFVILLFLIIPLNISLIVFKRHFQHHCSFVHISY
jgi:hypothetical protein